MSGPSSASSSSPGFLGARAGPAAVVLLHSPLRTAGEWGDLPGLLTDRGLQVIAPEIEPAGRPPHAGHYIAEAALQIARARPPGGVLLVAAGAAGPLLPQVAAAQRAAHRPVGGYVLRDALHPQGGAATWAELAEAQIGADPAEIADGGAIPPGFRSEAVPLAQDWPDAPCRYVHEDDRYAHCAELARMRGWAVLGPGSGGAHALSAALLEWAGS